MTILNVIGQIEENTSKAHVNESKIIIIPPPQNEKHVKYLCQNEGRLSHNALKKVIITKAQLS